MFKRINLNLYSKAIASRDTLTYSEYCITKWNIGFVPFCYTMFRLFAFEIITYPIIQINHDWSRINCFKISYFRNKKLKIERIMISFDMELNSVSWFKKNKNETKQTIKLNITKKNKTKNLKKCRTKIEVDNQTI